MLLRTAVLLTSRLKSLMKGVGPAVSPVIVIVVSSAKLAPAICEATMKAAATTITKHFFIHINFYTFYPRKCPEDFRPGRLSPAKIWAKSIFFGAQLQR